MHLKGYIFCGLMLINKYQYLSILREIFTPTLGAPSSFVTNLEKAVLTKAIAIYSRFHLSEL